MEEIVTKIISYLNIGSSPTILSFPDDGIMHIFDILSEIKQKPQNYDPTYAFVYLSTQSLRATDIETVELAIETELQNTWQKGIVALLMEGYDIVVTLDDVEIYGDAYQLVASIDGIVKKYKNKIRFIYLIETPNIGNKFQKNFPVSSTIFDATIYFKIGTWDKDSITTYGIKKPFVPISAQHTADLSAKTHNHFGLFMRMYRDQLMDSNHTDSFIEYLLDDFTLEEISAFKKLVHKMKLNQAEQAIVDVYAKVGFIENGDIAIPLIKQKLVDYRIKQEAVDEKNRLNINFDLFTTSEKAIVENIYRQGEISKEEVAKLIWGSQADEKYSEWAIEQRISRLRRKLRQLGYRLDIGALYNKGYKLILN